MRSRHHPSILHGASSPHYYLLDYVLRLLSFIIIIIDYVPNINLGPVSSAGPFWDSFLYHRRRSPLPARSSSFIGCRLYYISIESQTIYGVTVQTSFYFIFLTLIISFLFYFLSVITARYPFFLLIHLNYTMLVGLLSFYSRKSL